MFLYVPCSKWVKPFTNRGTGIALWRLEVMSVADSPFLSFDLRVNQVADSMVLYLTRQRSSARICSLHLACGCLCLRPS
jgi:hypothetical protein